MWGNMLLLSVTSSRAVITTGTASSQDIVAPLLKRDIEAGREHDHIRNNRLYVPGSAS
jgi:SSS family solute:Na+ symporter